MTKLQFRSLILAELRQKLDETNKRIIELTPGKDHPQIKEVLIRNSGYKIAIDDMIEFIQSIRERK